MRPEIAMLATAKLPMDQLRIAEEWHGDISSAWQCIDCKRLYDVVPVQETSIRLWTTYCPNCGGESLNKLGVLWPGSLRERK